MVLPLKNHKTSHMRRFVVKYKRRRQCKTDYRKRRRLVGQYKNKYGAQKLRLVVRQTNRDVVCQLFAAEIDHDRCLVAAYSHELPRYGVRGGLTNYAAAYCTGLLLARRLYARRSRDNEGNPEVNGEFFLDDESDAFRAFLDTGLSRCSTGANLFGVLKGAVDGGLNVPHNTRRFPGSTYGKNDDGIKEWEYDPEKHRERIFGEHVAEYMRKLQSENPKKYENQFSRFVAQKIGPDDLEPMYRKAHEKIRAEPDLPRGEKERGYFAPNRKSARKSPAEYAKTRRDYSRKKLTGKEKKLRALDKLAAKAKATEAVAA